MNKRMILYIQGAILLIEAAIMVLPIAAALIYREPSGIWFFYTALAAAIIGFAAMKLAKPRSKTIYAKEGLIAVAAGWIVLSLVGALPFTLSGEIPIYLDAVFEMISGFTTTGSSILPNVEALSRCMLLWRSFSHWLGGMGILVFMIRSATPLQPRARAALLSRQTPLRATARICRRSRRCSWRCSV